MIARVFFLGIAILGMGCGSEPEPDSDTSSGGACGAVTEHVMEVAGLVEDSAGNVVIAANVRLEDRGWEPGTVLGEGITDSGGSFSLTELNVTGVEDCWGVLLDYVLVAESNGKTGEKQINHQLFNAVVDGSMNADLSSFPIVID